MKGKRVLYPCYFNANLQRKEGRRVSRTRGFKNPGLIELEQAAKRAGLSYRTENKHHSAHWWRREGRIVVEWEGSKELLLKKIAARMEMKTEVRK